MLVRLMASFQRIAAHSVLRVMAAGALATLAISYPVCWPLAPLALAIFFYDLWSAPSFTGSLWRSFLFGAITGGAGIWWFWDTLPLNWLGLSHGPNEWYFVFASWGPVTLAFAAASTLITPLIWLIRRSPYRALGTALIWVLVEEARMWSFSLLTFADRSFYGPHFSAPSLGYAFAENHYLLQIADGGGIYFLNFAVALTAAVCITLPSIRKHVRSIETISLAVLCLVLLIPLAHTQAKARHGSDLKAVLISTDLPVGVAEVPPHQYQTLLTTAARTFPEATLFILPEEKRLEPTFPNEQDKATFLKEVFGNRDIRIVSGIHLPGKDRGYDAALTYETVTGERLGTYIKRFLMPGGEYMPTLMRMVFSLRPDSGLGWYMNSLPERRNVQGELPTASFEGHILGGLICSDFLSPHLYRELSVQGHADILINIANPAWFHHSRILFDKTVAIAKVHAVQNRAYYLQSTNGAPAFAINPEGHIIGMSAWGGTSMLEVAVTGAP